MLFTSVTTLCVGAIQSIQTTIIFVVAGIFSAITVWVSIKKPFKIAATISPIEATRYYEKDNYHSANKNRLSFKNRITEMAWRNLRRNSKRTIFIVLSMILCIILLNSAIAIGNSGLIGFLLGSIGLVNFSNIIITGIINRQREFATLESIGMTKKQINKLTVLEGLFYAFLICVTLKR